MWRPLKCFNKPTASKLGSGRGVLRGILVTRGRSQSEPTILRRDQLNFSVVFESCACDAFQASLFPVSCLLSAQVLGPC